MTPKSLLAGLVLALIVATAGYLHFQVDVTEAPLTDSHSSPISPVVPVDQSTDADLPLPSSNSVTTAPEADESDPPKQYARTITGELVEYEVVLGLKVKKDRNCTVRIDRYNTNEDGTTSPVYSCVPNEPKPVDIYTTYSNAELETLAYSDSHAAYNLTLRLRERDYARAIDYGLRSAALTGDIKGIALMTVYIPHSAKIDGKVNLKYIEEQYVLSGVAQAIDSSSTMHNRVFRHAMNYQGNGINIEALDARIANHLRTIENIRSEVGID